MKNKLKILFFLSITLFCSNLFAEKVNKIVINGNTRISDETIKTYGDIKINDNVDEKKLDKILKSLFSTNFFEDINIDLTNNVLKIDVQEYPIINQLILVGEKRNKTKEEIKKIIRLKEKSSFIKSYLSGDIATIKRLYSSLGYNFTKVDAKVNKISEKNFDILIEIDRGNQTRISSIRFIGDKKVKEKRLRDLIASEEDKFWKILSRNTKFSQNLIDLDIRLLTNYYKSIGYYDVKINSSSAELNADENIDLIYSIEAGTRYRINKISTNLDQVFNKSLFSSLEEIYKDLVGDYYSPFKIKEVLNEIDDLIDKNNLQFVEHNVEESIESDKISLKFNIFEGEKILVERINILGNNVTNESVIRGELILDEGDPFTKLNLEKSISKIKSRNIFNSVNYEVINGESADTRVVNIKVEERPTGEISAGAGIGTNGGTFGIGVTENNWLGKGNNLNFELEVDQESLGGQISYTNPNYNNLGNSVKYFLSSSENDKPDQGYENSIIELGASTGFEQFRDITTSLGFAASYDDLRTLDNASASLKKQSGTFSEISGNYGIIYDKRDRSFMPTDGFRTAFSQRLPIVADKQYLSNILSTSVYKSFSEDIIGSSKFFVSTVTGIGEDDVRLSKRTKLSNRRLRGFQKNKVGPVDGSDHIGGNYAAAINFEANLPNFLPEDSKTDVGLFLDFGNVWGVDYDSSIDDSNKIRSSTGVAASWLSPIGPMTFTLSQNLSKADTDETESFNFNLGTTF
tara:strand:+ start:4673 stop:6910 length:2238 start_codon:yes stop_codon:yes gene_type:complete